MSYSYYEVYTYTHRAFEGLGFPYGADEDAAFIITWLELYNLDGVHLLASNINKFDQKYDGVVDQMHSDNLINLKNKSSLMVAPGLIDYLESKTKTTDNQILVLENCSYPIFFIPVLANLLKKQIYTIVKISNNIVCVMSENKISISDKLLRNLEAQQSFSISLTKKNNFFNNLDFNIDLTNKKESLSLGVDPKKKDWEKILQIASRIYVPESDESREKGAGGGDAND